VDGRRRGEATRKGGARCVEEGALGGTVIGEGWGGVRSSCSETAATVCRGKKGYTASKRVELMSR
jgi:hypothetical protein